MTMAIGPTEFDDDGHGPAQCKKPFHNAHVYAVYDPYGQLVNAGSVCADVYPKLGTELQQLADHCARAWPGNRFAVWHDANVRPPMRLSDGPTPDAVGSL